MIAGMISNDEVDMRNECGIKGSISYYGVPIDDATPVRAWKNHWETV
jgi:hypothetical protein